MPSDAPKVIARRAKHIVSSVHDDLSVFITNEDEEISRQHLRVLARRLRIAADDLDEASGGGQPVTGY